MIVGTDCRIKLRPVDSLYATSGKDGGSEYQYSFLLHYFLQPTLALSGPA